MRGIRFRDAITAYLVGVAVVHLRLLSPWSVTAARLCVWLTEERGPMPPPLESYRTTETALKVYADSISEENDEMREALRLGVSALFGKVVREAGNRLHAAAALAARTAWDLARGAALAVLTVWTAVCASGFVVLLVGGLIEAADGPAVQGPPDAGVERPVRRRAPRFVGLCMAESPHYVLRWTSYERAPRLIVIGTPRYYWWEEQALPFGYAACPLPPLRDCGGELYPRPHLTAGGDELVVAPVIIVLD